MVGAAKESLLTYLLRRPLLALALFFAVPIDARAACNLIPGTEKTFGSALGATNRPFAAPGERLELRLRSSTPRPDSSPTAPTTS